MWRSTAASASASTGPSFPAIWRGRWYSRAGLRRTTSPKRSGACVLGAWTCRAGSSRRKASRIPKRSAPSLQRSGMRTDDLPAVYNLPDSRGHFGPYGGVFVAETLSQALGELREAYDAARKDAAFEAEFRYELK